MLQVDDPAQHLLPRRRQHGLRQRRQPLPGHRRQHQPVRVRLVHPDRRAGRAGRTTTRSAPPATPTTCAARCCGSTRRPTAPTPSRRATSSPPGTAQTRPEIYAMGFRNPFRIGIDPTDQHAVRRRLRPGRRRGQPEPRPRGHGRVEHRRPPGNYGWPYCHGDELRLQRLHVPVRPERREVRLRGAGQQLAQQHRPDQPAAGDRRPPSTTTTAATRCSRRSAAAARRWAARSTATTPTLDSDRKWPAYYDGKAMFGEWNQNKMYTMQVDRRRQVAGGHQPAAHRR